MNKSIHSADMIITYIFDIIVFTPSRYWYPMQKSVIAYSLLPYPIFSIRFSVNLFMSSVVHNLNTI